MDKIAVTAAQLTVLFASSGASKVRADIQSLSSMLSKVSGAGFSIDTSKAIGSLSKIEAAAKDAGSAVTAASGQAFSVDTTAALGDLDRIGAAAQGAGIAVRSASGSVFTVDTSAALGDLAKVSGAAQDASSAIAGAGGTIDVDSSQIKDAETAATGLRGSLGRFSGSIEIAGVNVFADATAAASELRSSMGRFSGNIELSGIGTIKAAQGAAQDLAATLGALSGGAVDFSGAAAQLRSMAADAQSIASSIGSASGASLSGGGGGAFGGLASVLPTAAIAGGLGAGLKTGWDNAIGLDQALVNVRATLGNVSNADMARLNTSIIQIGVNSQYSGVEVAGISEELAKAGYGIDQQLNGNMLQGVVNLASATGTALPTAITGVTQAMAIWSPAIVDNTIAMTDSAKAADILTVAANASSADVNDIIAGVRNLGPIAAQMHIPFEQVAGAVAMFTNYGLKGADAGVSLARGLQNLNNPTSEASQLMGQLGINVFDAQGSFVGFPTLFDELHTSMAGMTDQQKLTNIGILFGAEAQDVFTQAIAAGKDPLVEIVKLMDHHGLAAEQAAKRQDTLNFAIQRFTEGLGTTLGSLFAPFLGPAKEALDVVSNLISKISQLAAPIRAVLGLALSLGSALAGFKALSAIKGIFGLLTGGGAAAGAGAGEAAAGAGLLSTALPILAGVAVVAGAGFLAYKTNFMGFGDLVKGGVSGVKQFTAALTGANPKVDQLTKTQRAWVDGLRASKQPQEVIDQYLRAQGVSAEYAQKKYDNLSKTQRAWVDGLRASGQPQAVIDAYLRAQGVSAEYTTSKYQHLLTTMNPLAARSTMLADAFDAIGWTKMADGTRGAITFFGNLTSTFGKLSKTENPVAAGFGAIKMALFGINGDNTPAFLVKLGMAMGDVEKGVQRLTTGFTLGRTLGLNPFQAGLLGLGMAIPALTPLLNVVSESVGHVTDAVGSFVAGDYVQGFKDLGSAAQTIGSSLGGLAVDIGGWVISSTADLGSAIFDWVQNTAIPNIGDAASTVYGILVSIGSWAKGTIADLAPKVKEWATSAMSTATEAAGTIWNVIVNIGSWAKGIVSDLWPYITQWTSSLMSGVSSAAGTLWGVLVNIGSWAQGIISDIWPYITMWTSSLISGVSSAAGTLWGVIVNIGSWAKGTISDLWPYITMWTSSLMSGVSSAAGTLWNVIVNVGSWAQGQISDLWPYITMWTSTLIGGASSAAGTIWNVIVNVGSWAQGIISDIWPYITMWTSALMNGASSAAGTLWGVLINIGSWAKGIVSDIAPYVAQWATSAMTGLTNAAATIWGMVINIGSWGKGIISDIGPYITQWIGEQISGIDWSGTSELVATGFAGAFDAGKLVGSLDTAGVDMTTGLLDWITGQIKAVNWDTAGQSVGQLLGDAIVGVFTGGAALVGLGGAFLGGFLNSLIAVDWGSLGTAVWDLVMAGIKGFVSFEVGLWKGLTDSLLSAFKGVDWSALGTAIKSGITGALSGIDIMDIIPQSWKDFGNDPLGYITGHGDPSPSASANQKTLVNGASAGKPFAANLSDLQRGGGGGTTTTTFAQVGGEAVAAMAATINVAIASIPASKLTALAQAGGETVAAVGSAVSTALMAIPAVKFSTIGQVGAEAVTSSSNAAQGAVNAIPDVKFSTIGQVGAEAVAGSAYGAGGAVQSIPTGWFTSIGQAGAEEVAGSAYGAGGAVEAIPTSWFTAITEAGGAAVTGSASAAAGAISSIPTSWNTVLSIAGAETVIGSANAAAAAVNAVQGKTVYIDVVTRGGTARATGGTVNEPFTRLADGNGPELLKYPSGGWGMAAVDGLYTMPKGTFVFTAEQTRAMMQTASNIPAFAGGGFVGGSGVNADLLDIARNLAAYGGDYTPKPIVDVLVQIRELGKVGGATTEQLKMFSDQLKAFNADNTPKAIVDQALRLDKIASSPQSGQSSAQGLTGVYNDAARMFGRAIGSMGGAIINGWEKLTNGFWKSVASGTIQKGKLAEDGSYVNPGFYANGGIVQGFGKNLSAWMGELGPELLRMPNGQMGVAMTEGMYQVPKGTFVYTADETRRMAKNLKVAAIGTYASGGMVGISPSRTPTFTPSMASRGNTTQSIVINAPLTVNGDVHGIDDFERKIGDIATRMIVPELQRSLTSQRRGQGL